MAGKPVAALGNLQTCPLPSHIGGPIIKTQTLVKIDGIPAAVEGDTCLCTGCGKTAEIVSGSSIVKIDGKPVARIGDNTSHGGTIVQGVPNITIE